MISSNSEPDMSGVMNSLYLSPCQESLTSNHWYCVATMGYSNANDCQFTIIQIQAAGNYLTLESFFIKTHGSVSCGPRSRRATPASSRHTVVCRTKTQFSRIRNFVLLVQNKTIFFCGDALHHQHPTFQISTKSRQVFPRYELSKIGLVFLVFFFLFVLV